MTCKTGLVDHQRTRIFILGKQGWEQISEITDIKPPKASKSEDDVTTLEDTDKTIVTAGAREHSNVEVTMLEISGSEMQRRLYLANYNSTCERFKIVKPDMFNTTYEFSGYIKEFGDETDPTKKTRIQMSITVSGKVGKYDDNGYITPDFQSESPYAIIPSVSNISIQPNNINSRGQTAQVTIKFDQKVSLQLSDMTADHGQLSDLQTTDNISFTATFTPDNAVNNQTGRITVKSYKNIDGRKGKVKSSDEYTVNTLLAKPVVSSIQVNPDTITTGLTAQVTVTFDKKVVGFELSDMTADHGQLSDLQTSDDTVFTATFTPDDSVSSQTGRITITAQSYTNEDGVSGDTAQSDEYTVNTV